VSQSGPIYYTLIWQVLGFAGPSFTQLSKQTLAKMLGQNHFAEHRQIQIQYGAALELVDLLVRMPFFFWALPTTKARILCLDSL